MSRQKICLTADEAMLSTPSDEASLTRVVLPTDQPPLERPTAELLIDAVTDIALIIFDADGSIVSWNKGAELIYGWSKDEIVGKPVSLLSAPEAPSQETLQQELRLVRKRGRYEAQGIRSRKDGST